MKILVDRCIWSAVLRQQNPSQNLSQKLKDSNNDGRLAIIGQIHRGS